MGLKFRRGTTAQKSGSLAFGEPYVNTDLGTLQIGGATGDITLGASGTGSQGSFAGISGSSLDITGNAKIDGNLTLGGAITIGDQTTDTVNVVASLSSSLVPSVTNAFDLGSATKIWRDLYISTGSIKIVNPGTGTVVGTISSNSDGTQTFNTTINANGGVLIGNSVQVSGPGLGIGGYGDRLMLGTSGSTGMAQQSLIFTNTSESKAFTFPNANGTIALTSDLTSGYVTLGTTQTISGSKTFNNDLVVNGLKVGKGLNSITTNTAVGVSALSANTSGSSNTAIGSNALKVNTTGVANTAIGADALQANETTTANTAVGWGALRYNTGANGNTAVGSGALQMNTTGNGNTAVGNAALSANVTGVNNTALGTNVLGSGNGNNNIGVGTNALVGNISGSYNIGIGYTALEINTTGNGNIVIGDTAGNLITTGNYNTIIGKYAGTAALSNNIVLADGEGNIKYRYDGTNNNLYGNVNVSGSIIPEVTNTYDLGSPTKIWRDIYVSTGSIKIINPGTGTVVGTITSNANGDINTGTQNISGSLNVTGSIIATQGITGQINATNGVISGSSQVIGILSSLNTYTGSNDTTNTTQNTSISNLNAATSSYETKGRSIVSGSAQIDGSLLGSNKTITVGSTSITLGGTATTIAGLTSVTSTGFTGALTGNASTATTLQTARAINGVNFDGSAAITVTAAAGTLSGATLASGVTASSLTSVGTLTSLTVTGAITANGGIAVTGAITATGDITAYYTSDKRHKNNIQTIPNALEKVTKLNGVTWEWNDDVNEVTKSTPKTGLIAQEVQEVLPEVVKTRDDGFLALDYSKMMGLMVEAIKEQQTQIHSLTLEIEKLKESKGL